RERDVGVTEPLADHLHRDPVLDDQASVRMTKIMKPDRGYAGVVQMRRNASYTAWGCAGWPSPSVNTHPSSLVMPTAANSAVCWAPQPARTARVVSSSAMARRALRVLPRVWWTS